MKVYFPILALLFTMQTWTVFSQEQTGKKINYEQNDKLIHISVAKEKLLSFDYAFQQKATSFKLKVPAYPTHQNSGRAFDAASRELLKKAKQGASIQIFDIKDDGNSSVSKPVVIKVI